MANMSNYLENQLVDHIFRTSSFTKPSVLAIALVTSAANDSQTGATISEVPDSNSYARVQLNPLDANWAAPVGGDGVTSNLAAIEFPQATGPWGTVVGLAILDSATHGAGNVLFWGNFAENKTVGTDDSVTIDIGNLTVTLN